MTMRITINDQPYQVETGITVLQAARQNGIYIPTLCDHPLLRSQGSCRMCIVEIKGRPNTPTSCTTPVEEGMVIYTDSPKVQDYRADLLQMLLSEHPSSCLFCPENSHCDECMVTLRKAGVTTGCRSCPKDAQCDLQEMAQRLEITQPLYPVRYRGLRSIKNDPFFDRDYNLCILCGRCIRICEDHHFTNVITYVKRGTDTLVGTTFGQTLLESGCTFCGACVEICPTGSLSEKARKWDGKPDRETITTCPLCSIGCQMKVLSKFGTVIGSLPAHQNGSDELCVKGRFGITELVNHPSRLTHPVHFDGRHSIKIDWDEAIRLAAEKASQTSPVNIRVIVSPSLTNESLYIASKFAKIVNGMGRIEAPSLQSYQNELEPMRKLLSLSQATDRIDLADCILCLGFDGQYAQSVIEVQIRHAMTRGAKLLTVSPKPNSLGKYATHWLKPEFGKELDLVKFLLMNDLPDGMLPDAQNIGPAAELIQTCKHLVIVIGPEFMRQSAQAGELARLEKILSSSTGDIILLPAEGNLAGILSLPGLNIDHRRTNENAELIFCIGEEIPSGPEGNPFIVYMNMYPPSTAEVPDLTLPITPFTEEDGTLINQAGVVQEIRQAVMPAGASLPVWEVLTRIARQLGYPGFEFQNTDEIQAEIESLKHGFAPDDRFDDLSNIPQDQDSANNLFGHVMTGLGPDPHVYMGFPLDRWVAGFGMLQSERQTRSERPTNGIKTGELRHV